MAADRQTSERESDPPESKVMRLASLPQRLHILERITAESIRDPQVRPYRPRAQFTFFCGADPADLSGYSGQLEVVGRCLEWFVFDYIIAELNKTPAEHWLNNHDSELTDEDFADAYECLKFVLGLFEISHVQPGEGFLALDLLRAPACYTVRENLITREIRAGQLLLGRLFPHRGDFVLSGMAGLMDAHATEQIKQLTAAGKLKPNAILPVLDGLELENLMGRSVHEIADITDLEVIHRRLRRYLEVLPNGPVGFKELVHLIKNRPDPLDLAAELCQRFQVFCRHEMDLLFTLIITAWNRMHPA